MYDLTIRASWSLRIIVPRELRFIFWERRLRKWLRPAALTRTLPLAVILKRFLAPDLVFILGILLSFLTIRPKSDQLCTDLVGDCFYEWWGMPLRHTTRASIPNKYQRRAGLYRPNGGNARGWSGFLMGRTVPYQLSQTSTLRRWADEARPVSWPWHKYGLAAIPLHQILDIHSPIQNTDNLNAVIQWNIEDHVVSERETSDFGV